MSLPIQITTVTIRRVQNGFVVDCINEDVAERYNSIHTEYRGPQRACYVAADVKEIATLLQSFVDMGDVGWSASLPMPVMTRRVPSGPPSLDEDV